MYSYAYSMCACTFTYQNKITYNRCECTQNCTIVHRTSVLMESVSEPENYIFK